MGELESLDMIRNPGGLSPVAGTDEPNPTFTPLQPIEAEPAPPRTKLAAQPQASSASPAQTGADEGTPWQQRLMGVAAALTGEPFFRERYAQMLNQRGLQQVGQAMLKSQQAWEAGDHQGAMATFDQIMQSPALRMNPQLYMQALNHRLQMGQMMDRTRRFQAMANEIPDTGVTPTQFLQLGAKYGLDTDMLTKMAPVFGKREVQIVKDDFGNLRVYDNNGNLVRTDGPQTMGGVNTVRKDAFTEPDHAAVRQASQELGYGPKYNDAWMTTLQAQGGDRGALDVLNRSTDIKKLGQEPKITDQVMKQLGAVNAMRQAQGKAPIDVPKSGLMRDLPRGWEAEAFRAEQQADQEKQDRLLTRQEALVDKRVQAQIDAMENNKQLSETGHIALNRSTGQRVSGLTLGQARQQERSGQISILSRPEATINDYAQRGLMAAKELRRVSQLVLGSAVDANGKPRVFPTLAAALDYGISRGAISSADKSYLLGEFNALQSTGAVEAASAESRGGQGIARLLETVKHQIPGVFTDTTQGAHGKIDVLESNLENLTRQITGMPLVTPQDVRARRQAADATAGRLSPEAMAALKKGR